MSQKPVTTNIEALYRVQLITWLVILSSVCTMLLISTITTPFAASQNTLLVWILAGIGLLTSALSFILKRKFTAEAIESGRPETLLPRLVIALALCELSAIFGLALFFVTGTRYYLFFVLSIMGVLLHMPRRDPLRAASFKSGGQGLMM